MFTPDVIVFDFECTGFSHNNDRVIDIGAVNLATGEKFQMLVNPEIKQIPANIVELTHITNEMVKNAPSQKEAFIAFREFIGDCTILLGHNVPFDLRFLIASFERLGIEYNQFRYIDTQRIMGKLHPGLSQKLCDVCACYGVVNEAAHRAYDDAYATAQVYEAMIIDAINMSSVPLADMRMPDIFAATPFQPKAVIDESSSAQLSFAPTQKPAPIKADAATEKQISYLQFLATKTGDKTDLSKLTKKQASELIERLKKQAG